MNTKTTVYSKTESKQEQISLPEPDSDNITVLSHKLPNKPILPWNRYDSPWDNSENGNNDNHKQDSSENEEEDQERIDKTTN